jgi:hypothetical protein
MSYWKEGVRKNFLLVILFSILLMTSPITFCPLTSTNTNGHNFYEKSIGPKSNDSLVNTTLQVLINNTHIQIGDLLNITVFYKDNNSNPLHGANITLLSFGELTENKEQYTIIINSSTLVLGLNILTIFAQLDGYQNQTYYFIVNVVGRATRIRIFLNSIDKTDDPVLDIPIGTLINITVKFYDNRTGLEIPNALVQIMGETILENLTENSISKQYTIIINSSILELEPNLLTIFAQLEGYQNQAFQIIVNAFKRATRTGIFLNAINKTDDPFLEVPIGTLINITVKFYDNQTGLEIPNALVQIMGETILENLTENSILKQYSIILNSSNLLLGSKTFIVVAQAPNYEEKIIFLRIDINRIRANISGNSLIAVMVDEVVHIEVELIDLDFGGSILDATVVYSWQFGQGVLTDPDSNGIYEVLLVGTMPGIYSLVISAYKGENYEFESFTIIIVISQSPKSPKFIIPGYTLFIFIGIMLIFSLITIHKQVKHNNKNNINTKKEKHINTLTIKDFF